MYVFLSFPANKSSLKAAYRYHVTVREAKEGQRQRRRRLFDRLLLLIRRPRPDELGRPLFKKGAVLAFLLLLGIGPLMTLIRQKVSRATNQVQTTLSQRDDIKWLEIVIRLLASPDIQQCVISVPAKGLLAGS